MQGDLLTPEAVRGTAQAALALARAGRLAHWVLHEGRMPATADFVARVVRESYPTLAVPFHARWRHFAVDLRSSHPIYRRMGITVASATVSKMNRPG